MPEINVKLPKSINEDLSYETGVQIGDGWLSKFERNRPKRTVYEIGYCGNLSEELIYYKKVLKPLVKKLYGKNVKISEKGLDNTCVIKFESRKIFDFKNKILGIPISPKSTIHIPRNFLKERKNTISVLRGIFDTDFSLVFLKKYKSRKYYPKIRSEVKSKPLAKQLCKLIEEVLGIKPFARYDIKRFDKRTALHLK